MPKKQYYLFLFLAFLVIFIAGFQIGKDQVVCKVCKPEQVDFSLFWETWSKLKENYVDSSQFDEKKMLYGAISGMVQSLDDPYTVFFNPDDKKKFLEDVNGRFEGVGMEVGIKEKQLQVIAPLEGTPAKRAGLRPGDKILKIGDITTQDMTVDKAVSLIRGKKGTEVVLLIMRDGWQTAKEIKIQRDVIEVPSLKMEMKDDIAYIRLYQFSERTGFDFQQTAILILNSQAKGIVLDLRGNPGGYLEVARDIAGWFLEKGKVVVTEDFNGKKESIIYKAEGSSSFLEYPMVILINEGSASASEILAAALRDNNGIKLVGEKSYGKGVVQVLESLSGDSSLKVTVANWLTPKGEKINGKGLEPDVKVEITEKDYEQEKDPQLDKALEIINNLK